METKRSFKKTAKEVAKWAITGAALCVALVGCASYPTTDGRGRIHTIGGEPVAFVGNPVVAHNEAWQEAKDGAKAMLRQHNARSRYDNSWSWGGRSYSSQTTRIRTGNLDCTIRIRETSPLFGTADCTEIAPRAQRRIRMNCDVYGNAYNEVEEMRCVDNFGTRLSIRTPGY